MIPNEPQIVTQGPDQKTTLFCLVCTRDSLPFAVDWMRRNNQFRFSLIPPHQRNVRWEWRSSERMINRLGRRKSAKTERYCCSIWHTEPWELGIKSRTPCSAIIYSPHIKDSLKELIKLIFIISRIVIIGIEWRTTLRGADSSNRRCETIGQ
jgi:hypothetical protein